MKVAVVTGARGFTGRHLVEFLRKNSEYEVYGVSRDAVDGGGSFDLTGKMNLHDLLEKVRPTMIFHCIGSFTNMWETDFQTNVESSHILLDSVRLLKLQCRVLLIGSAAEYGNTSSGAVAETVDLRPVTIYGMTKAMQTMLMDFFVRNDVMDILMARTFNLYGDGCSPLLFPGRIYEQIARIKQGLQRTIQVRSLAARRDYLPIADAVRAYVRIMEYGQRGEVYNVGSGVPMQLTELVKKLLLPTGFSMNDVEILSGDENTKTNVAEIYADVTKLNQLPSLEFT